MSAYLLHTFSKPLGFVRQRLVLFTAFEILFWKAGLERIVRTYRTHMYLLSWESEGGRPGLLGFFLFLFSFFLFLFCLCVCFFLLLSLCVGAVFCEAWDRWGRGRGREAGGRDGGLAWDRCWARWRRGAAREGRW